MTSYDEIFTCFLENTKMVNNNIPTDIDRKHEMIHNACRFYENKMGEVIAWDDILETINKELNNSEMLIMAYCLKRIYHENALTEFTSIWSGFTKEVGIKDYKSQVDAKQNDINRTEHKIDELITNIEDASIMEG